MLLKGCLFITLRFFTRLKRSLANLKRASHGVIVWTFRWSPAYDAAVVLQELRMRLIWILEASAVWRPSQHAALGLGCDSTDLQLISEAHPQTSTLTYPSKYDTIIHNCTFSPVTVKQSIISQLDYVTTQWELVPVTHHTCKNESEMLKTLSHLFDIWPLISAVFKKFQKVHLMWIK